MNKIEGEINEIKTRMDTAPPWMKNIVVVGWDGSIKTIYDNDKYRLNMLEKELEDSK